MDWLVVPRLLRDFPTYRDVPTNGALMIAVAVALTPARLVISGIDLYSHPQGKYPGVADDPQGYDAAHSRETDIACIRDALWRHKGPAHDPERAAETRPDFRNTGLATGILDEPAVCGVELVSWKVLGGWLAELFR